MIGRRLCGLGLLLATAAPPPTVLVRLSDAAGPEWWREQVEAGLLAELNRSGCLDSRERLRLEVQLGRMEEETRFDISLAARLNPDRPPEAAHAYDALLRYAARFRLVLEPEERELRVHDVTRELTKRPRLSEDAGAALRVDAVQDAVDAARRFACKWRGRKLEREIARARAAPAAR